MVVVVVAEAIRELALSSLYIYILIYLFLFSRLLLFYYSLRLPEGNISGFLCFRVLCRRYVDCPLASNSPMYPWTIFLNLCCFLVINAYTSDKTNMRGQEINNRVELYHITDYWLIPRWLVLWRRLCSDPLPPPRLSIYEPCASSYAVDCRLLWCGIIC